jgi:hypothetical protein
MAWNITELPGSKKSARILSSRLRVLCTAFVLTTGAISTGMSVGAVFGDEQDKKKPGAPESKEATKFSPARTPEEALAKFHECMSQRDFAAAAKFYLGGKARQQFESAAESASKLSKAIDELDKALDVTRLNSPDGRFVLKSLQPFSKDFRFTVKASITDKDYAVIAASLPDEFPKDNAETLKERTTLGLVEFDMPKSGDPDKRRMKFALFESRILMSLCPIGARWDGVVALKEDGLGKDKGWRIYMPVPLTLKTKADYLKENYSKYEKALKQLTYAVHHDAMSAREFEDQLQNALTGTK